MPEETETETEAHEPTDRERILAALVEGLSPGLDVEAASEHIYVRVSDGAMVYQPPTEGTSDAEGSEKAQAEKTSVSADGGAGGEENQSQQGRSGSGAPSSGFKLPTVVTRRDPVDNVVDITGKSVSDDDQFRQLLTRELQEAANG